MSYLIGNLSGAVALGAALVLASPAFAEDIDRLPPAVIFVTSTGYWQEEDGSAKPPVQEAEPGGQQPAQAIGRRGYYKLVAVRQPDRTARIYLQQIAVDDGGPQVVSSIELEEITALKAYVSDIRPERPRIGAPQPGMFATVLLRTDPNAGEAENWTVMIDELGELTVEKATN
ncbi:hypothetical protein MRS76_20995 [Rhizobiaceae bacterium n13]|uniref:Uncharacterized protein n=1 Tax=Ferirhizobium litorale TaxID=2927786 RepID=A0AAE3QJU7_9HYPH|nr:hypothetical protein [Fererhizobium litorale]MDI7864420.1 hypothetical protein [Fererhizobium litorale]MDI7924666.1 hypothetical protein [Fererhizobium litorale]